MEENKCQCECGCNGRDEFLDDLCEKYQPIKDNLIQMLNEVQEQTMEDVHLLITYLDMLSQHLEESDYNMADVVCDEIGKYSYSGEIGELVKKLLENVINLDEDGAINIIRELKGIIVEV